jgi:hypothetical protein
MVPLDVPVTVTRVHLTRHVRVLCDCGGYDDYQPGRMGGPAYRSHHHGCGLRGPRTPIRVDTWGADIELEQSLSTLPREDEPR